MKARKTAGYVAWIAVAALTIAGCASDMTPYADRLRAFFYVPPRGFLPYSPTLLSGVGDKAWEVSLADTVNIDASSVAFTPVTGSSVIVGAKESPLDGERQAYFLLTGIDTASPAVIKKNLPGSVLSVNGKLCEVEQKDSGATLTLLDDKLEATKRLNLVLNKYRSIRQNYLDSSSSGTYHVEDNICSTYDGAYPWVVVWSVNYSTDKLYQYTRYQSQKVRYDAIQFACVNLETGETTGTAEVDFAKYFTTNIADVQGSLLLPSFFSLVANGTSMVFSLRDNQDNVVNCYFALSGEENSIYVDSAAGIVKRFPTLVLQPGETKTKEQVALEKAMDGQESITLGASDAQVSSFIVVPGRGFVVFGKEQGNNAPPGTVFYVDAKLNALYWKRDVGVKVAEGFLTGPAVCFPDRDKTGCGALVAKMLDGG